jgi:ATP-binding protein involved in chromosome partitioning
VATVDEEAIRQALARIHDPELKKPLTDLDMVRYVGVDGSDIQIGIALTAAGCPAKGKIQQDIIGEVSQLAGVDTVSVEFDTMSEEQRNNLRQQLGLDPAPSDQTVSVRARRIVAISSGKGGVGKSTVTVNLAAAFSRLGRRVGVLDADVYGFSIPRMLGVSGEPEVVDEKISPLKSGDNLEVVSMGFFFDEDQSVLWRGPMLHKAITQFLTDVAWSDLDFLFLDLPPGTGDVTLTIAQSVPSAEMIIVTTPQVSATRVAGRVARLAAKSRLGVLGVIENMSYLESDGERQYIFGQGGGRALAEQLHVPLLGEIPLMQSIREGADSGRPVAVDGTPEQVVLFESLARSIDSTARR